MQLSYHVSVLGTLQAQEMPRLRDDFQYSRRVMQSLEADLDAVSRDVLQLQQEGSVNIARGAEQEACGHNVSLKGYCNATSTHWPQQHVLTR